MGIELQNERLQESEIELVFVFQLEEQAASLQPQVSRFHPPAGNRADIFRVFLKPFPSDVWCYVVNCVPPRFVADQLPAGVDDICLLMSGKADKEFHAGMLHLSCRELPAKFDKLRSYRWINFLECRPEVCDNFPPVGSTDAPKNKLVPQVSFRCGSPCRVSFLPEARFELVNPLLCLLFHDLKRIKCVFQMINAGLFSFGHHNGNNVEPAFAPESFLPDVFVGCPNEKFLLVTVDKHLWLAEVTGGSGFDLNNHEHFIVESYNVNFILLAAPVGCEKSITKSPQVLRGEFFSFIAQVVVFSHVPLNVE